MNYPLITQTSSFDVAILALGDYPMHTIPVGVLQNVHHIICCDNAIENLDPTLYNKVEAVVGDIDSISEAFKAKFKDCLHIEHEQEDNDMTKATRYCIAQNYKYIVYLGATGLREDHTLGNISLLIEYLQRYHIQPTMLTNYGTFVPCYGDTTFQSFSRQQVSIFNISCNHLENKGLRWQSYPYKAWWQGTLNEALGNEFSFTADGYYLVYTTHEPKQKHL